MQNANNLNTNLNYLNAGEAGALADINRRTSLANDAYNTGLASANANIEAKYIQNLLDQRNQELARDLQERQFQEQIRQFNENLALQKAQLYSKSSGSGGGNNKTSNGYVQTNDTVAGGVGQVAGTPTRMIGGMGIVDTPVYEKNGKKYYKDATGKMVQIK